MPKANTGRDEKLELMLSLLNERSQPNLNMLNAAVRNLPFANMNIKNFGYDLARRLAAALPAHDGGEPRFVGLRSKASLQEDIESDWVAHWCAQLHTPVLYHRKLWELAYVLQGIHENGLMRDGVRGLGFGCGIEPLPSLLAARGVTITMTDQKPAEAQATGWATTNQHTTSPEAAFQPHLVDRARFDEKVELRYVDMNDIPADLTGYDFCWSICALEHLGSIDNGLNFIERSLATLKPGGIALHTTEFNISADGQTIDNWPTVLFQRKHFEQLSQRLAKQGHVVADLDFSLGDGPLDRFIDLPPFHHDLTSEFQAFLGDPQHLKVALDGFASTCFGLLVRKAA